MVNNMVSTTPITTRYTPKSKNSAVPNEPTMGYFPSNHIPVIGGSPNNMGRITLAPEMPNPMGSSDKGFLPSSFMVASVPLAKLCSTKAMEATSPPTNPPPG